MPAGLSYLALTVWERLGTISLYTQRARCIPVREPTWWPCCCDRRPVTHLRSQPSSLEEMHDFILQKWKFPAQS